MIEVINLLLKTIVCCIILLSSSAVGYLISLRYSLRVKQLNYLLNSLNGLETEIIYYSTPLPLAMDRVAKRSDRSISNIFEETSRMLRSREGYRIDEAWKKAVMRSENMTSLSKEDIEIIINFGKDLGIGNKEIQSKHFKFIKILLDEQKEKAIYEKNKNGEMYNRLGIVLGLAIVIIFI